MNQVSMMHEPSLNDYGVRPFHHPARISFETWIGMDADLESALAVTMSNEWTQIIDYVNYECL